MPSNVRASTYKEKKMPKKLDHLKLSQAENGGHTVEHIYTAPYDYPQEAHVFSPDQGHELVSHLAKHGGIKLDTGASAGTEEDVSAKEGAEL
jgi:hypothetical protein